MNSLREKYGTITLCCVSGGTAGSPIWQIPLRLFKKARLIARGHGLNHRTDEAPLYTQPFSPMVQSRRLDCNRTATHGRRSPPNGGRAPYCCMKQTERGGFYLSLQSRKPLHAVFRPAVCAGMRKGVYLQHTRCSQQSTYASSMYDNEHRCCENECATRTQMQRRKQVHHSSSEAAFDERRYADVCHDCCTYFAHLQDMAYGQGCMSPGSPRSPGSCSR